MKPVSQPISVFVPNASDTELATPDREILARFREANSGRGDVVFTESPEQAGLVLLFEQFSFKQKDYTKRLLADPFVRQWAPKLYVINYDDTVGTGFLPGCYVSVPQSCYDPQWHRACAYPKTYNECLDSTDLKNSFDPQFLFSFAGTLRSHPLRAALYEKLSGHPEGNVIDVDTEFHSHDKHEKKKYIESILNSRFVLCPRGHSPSTYRLFEVMQSGQCPVIISDEWVPVDGISWGECSVRVPEDQVETVPDLLRGYANQAEAMGKLASEAWMKHFSVDRKNRFYLDSILALAKSRSQSDRVWTVQRYRRYWNSTPFMWQNRWTVFQRLMRKVASATKCGHTK
jgi:hypothetical protein